MDLRIPWPDEHSRAYWDAAGEGKLLIQHCRECGQEQFYPRRHCVRCLAADPAWIEASGAGTLFAFTVVERCPDPDIAPELPYVFAVVELEEGVRISCNLVGGDGEELRCGDPVRLTQRRQREWTLPCFEPAGHPAQRRTK